MKLKIVLIVAFIALNLVVYLYTSNNTQARIDKALEYHSTKLDSNYNTYKYEQALTSKNLLTFIETSLIDDLKKINGANQSELTEIRKDILQKIQPIYARLKNKGLFQVQFVFPDNRSFLRVHKPSAFGDDLSEVRYSFKYVNETKKPIEGFESGKTKYGYRFVYPLYDEQGNYLCAVETSFSTNHLQEYFTNIMNLHTHYLIEKEVFNFKKWKPDEKELNYEESAENSDYMLVVTKHHTLQNCITNNSNELLSYKDEITNNMKKEKPFNIYVKSNSNHNIFKKAVAQDSSNIKVLSFKPIQSINGKALSWIVSYEEDSFIASTLDNATKIRILLFVLFIFVFYFIYRILNQQQQLKKLQSKLVQSNETLENSLKDIEHISMEQKTLLSLFDKGDSVLFKWNNDETWSVDFVSKSIEKLLGYDKEEFVKNKIHYVSLIHQDDIGQVMSEVENAVKNDVDFFRHEPYRVKVKSGEYKWLLDNTVIQKDENGAITHFIGYISDISKEKILEKKLIEINEHLQEKVEKAVYESRQKDTLLIQQSKMASMGEMIGNIAHQWRQPLNALGLTVQKIKMYHDEDMLSAQELDKAVAKSKKLIHKMSSTIDDFRNFFKVDKVKQKFVVNDAIDDTLELLEGSFKHNNIAVHKEYQSEKLELLGHKNEFEQVLLNIINNAKDALLQNHIKDAKIDIKLESNSQEIVINITDNAGGIPSEIIDKIFDPYFTTKEQGKGTGIGLYMSKMIIETNMNGKIEVQNSSDGASFTIKIPKESIDV